MTREERVRHEPRTDEASKPRDTKSQGIVRDERGQEQPDDKERAQRASKTDKAG